MPIELIADLDRKLDQAGVKERGLPLNVAEVETPTPRHLMAHLNLIAVSGFRDGLSMIGSNVAQRNYALDGARYLRRRNGEGGEVYFEYFLKGVQFFNGDSEVISLPYEEVPLGLLK